MLLITEYVIGFGIKLIIIGLSKSLLFDHLNIDLRTNNEFIFLKKKLK